MYWFTRPPYLRWALAALIVLAAFAIELRPNPTEQYPFVAEPLSAGVRLTPEHIEWRTVPAGLFDMPLLEGAMTDHALNAGEAIQASSLTKESLAPEGWWAVPIQLPVDAPQGTVLRIVVLDPPLIVEGLVVRPQVRDTFATSEPALVAVAPQAAEIVAAASARNELIVLMQP